METRLNYVLLGVFFIAVLLALAGFIFWMGKYDRNLSQYNQYYIYNKELPNGIRVETPVKYLGLPVGFVRHYQLSENEVEIVVWVQKEIVLNEGSKVAVQSQGLTGGNFLTLIQGKGEPFKQSQKAILGFKENWIEQVSSKAENVMVQLETSLERFNRLLNDKNLGNIEAGLQNFADVSDELYWVLKDAKAEIKHIGEIRARLNEGLKRGDYNLRLILTPLLFDLEQNSKALQKVLQGGSDTLEDFRDSPRSFLFDVTKQKLGPRE